MKESVFSMNEERNSDGLPSTIIVDTLGVWSLSPQMDRPLKFHSTIGPTWSEKWTAIMSKSCLLSARIPLDEAERTTTCTVIMNAAEASPEFLNGFRAAERFRKS